MLSAKKTATSLFFLLAIFAAQMARAARGTVANTIKVVTYNQVAGPAGDYQLLIKQIPQAVEWATLTVQVNYVYRFSSRLNETLEIENGIVLNGNTQSSSYDLNTAGGDGYVYRDVTFSVPLNPLQLTGRGSLAVPYSVFLNVLAADGTEPSFVAAEYNAFFSLTYAIKK